MDVVKKNLEKLKGRIDVRTKPGQGSTFILRIPLTLAIIEGMLVRVGQARYTIPLLVIRESFRPDRSQLHTTPEGDLVARLQALAHEKPVLLAEIGLDSRRHGEEAQAGFLDWQIRAAFEESKKAFKQAVGALYRQRRIEFTNPGIALVNPGEAKAGDWKPGAPRPA
jgi:hypothetical protein